MSRETRKQIVLSVLERFPETRNDTKALICRVWEAQGAQSLSDVLTLNVSSPSAIDRDRRRVDVLEKYPRSEEKFDYFVDYKQEFGNGQWAMRLE